MRFCVETSSTPEYDTFLDFDAEPDDVELDDFGNVMGKQLDDEVSISNSPDDCFHHEKARFSCCKHFTRTPQHHPYSTIFDQVILRACQFFLKTMLINYDYINLFGPGVEA